MTKTSNCELREKLILSGIKEIEEHGIKEFSLRRVASACNASCAAPYRHFKNKEELISEIFEFICSKWELLEKEIDSAYNEDRRKNIAEICNAYILFRIANPSFNSVLLSGDDLAFLGTKKYNMLENMKEKLRDLCLEQNKTKEEFEEIFFKLNSMILFGAVILNSETCRDEKLPMVKNAIEKEIFSI